jgi:hypothetical protein
VRLEERRLGKWVLLAGTIAGLIPVLYLSSLLVWGTWVAGPRPVPETRPAPALLKDALWARADGGNATGLRPINPITIVQHVACTELADWHDDPQARRRECRKYLPALAGVEYLATVHLQDQQIERASFRGGAGAMATTVWLSRSWTRENFLNTLAARAEFGFGWRGVDAAARGYFDKDADRLAVHEAALIAAFIAETYADPWCYPGRATELRNRILARMRDNGAVDEAAHQQALMMPLGVVPPPGNRPPCAK